MHDVYPLLKKTNFPNIYRGTLKTVQINLGYKCNQTCLHCHVNAGPTRKEMMTKETIEYVISFIKENNIKVIDLTGGAPELNQYFEYIIMKAKSLGCHIIDRCNLTVLLEPGKKHLLDFMKKNRVEIIASLPCYKKENVDAQRGDNVFNKSINVLKMMNKKGYGIDNRLILNLVYNPQGAVLPPDQTQLESQYKTILKKNHGIDFNNLYSITNMPILRFGSMLISQNKFNSYMDLLKSNFHKKTLNNLMCKSLISIDHLGHTYDCDFNQMLKLNISENKKVHIKDLDVKNLYKINTGDHCYGCTAGSGSSCGGTLV